MGGQVSSSFADEDGGTVSDINVTPLVDVVLVLLIVFMITMPAIVGSAPIKIDLPETSQITATAEKLPLNFFLRRGADGQLALFVNDHPAEDAWLKGLLKDLQPLDEQTVTLSADKDIQYGEVVRVMDRLAGFGLHKIALNTKPSGRR